MGGITFHSRKKKKGWVYAVGKITALGSAGTPGLTLKQKPSPQTQKDTSQFRGLLGGGAGFDSGFVLSFLGGGWGTVKKPFWRAASLVHPRFLLSECHLVGGLIFKGKSFTTSQWTNANRNRHKIIREPSKLCFPISNLCGWIPRQTQKG